MTNLIYIDSIDNNKSPFDSIKHLGENGSEFWTARELQVVLAYKQWRRFNDVIENAKENIETVGCKISDHFARRDNLVKRTFQRRKSSAFNRRITTKFV